MTAEIIKFPKAPVRAIPKGPVSEHADPEVVEVLEEMAECARRGEITFVGIGVVAANGNCYCAWAPGDADTAPALGAVSFLASSLAEEAVGNSNENPPGVA